MTVWFDTPFLRRITDGWVRTYWIFVRTSKLTLSQKSPPQCINVFFGRNPWKRKIEWVLADILLGGSYNIVSGATRSPRMHGVDSRFGEHARVMQVEVARAAARAPVLGTVARVLARRAAPSQQTVTPKFSEEDKTRRTHTRQKRLSHLANFLLRRGGPRHARPPRSRGPPALAFRFS